MEGGPGPLGLGHLFAGHQQPEPVPAQGQGLARELVGQPQGYLIFQYLGEFLILELTFKCTLYHIYMRCSAKILILNKEGINKKIS